MKPVCVPLAPGFEDGTVVTSLGAGTAMAFALRLVRLLADDGTAERLRTAMVA